MPLRTGFAGLGQIGAALLDATAREPDVVPVAVQDTDEAKIGPLTRELPDLAGFTSFERMIETANLDAVVISTPTQFHVPYARMALSRGIHVLLEPPLGRTPEEVDTLLDTAAAAGARLVLDDAWCHTPAAIAGRAAIAAGRIGTLRSVQARYLNIWGPPAPWYLDRAAAGGGVLMALGVPLLGLLSYLLHDPPLVVTAAYCWREGRPAGNAVEDFATLLGGVGLAPLHVEVSWQARLPRTEIRLVLSGTRGTLTIHNPKGSLFDFTATLGYHLGSDALAAGPADLRADSLTAFVAACAAPTGPDLAAYRRIPDLIDRAYRLAR